jgi:hypothetical protein
LLELIKAALESGEDVLISSFGWFCVKKKAKRRSRNPLLLHIWMHPVTAHNFKCSLFLLSKRDFLSIQSNCDVVGGGNRGCYIGNKIVVLQSDSTGYNVSMEINALLL